jgi:hypothetical protein
MRSYGNRYDIKTSFSFTESDGYIPLFMLHRMVGVNVYDIFGATPYTSYGKRSIKHNIRFNTTRSAHSIRNYLQVPNDTVGSLRVPRTCRISFGFLSTFVTDIAPEYLSMGFSHTMLDSFLLLNDVDVLTLGLIRKSSIQNSVTYSKNIIEINVEDMRWLISEDKMKPIKYMKDNYSPAVRTHMWTQINEISHKYGIVPEMVKDEEINKFFKFRSRFKTNSLQEVMSTG